MVIILAAHIMKADTGLITFDLIFLISVPSFVSMCLPAMDDMSVCSHLILAAAET